MDTCPLDRLEPALMTLAGGGEHSTAEDEGDRRLVVLRQPVVTMPLFEAICRRNPRPAGEGYGTLTSERALRARYQFALLA